ncbi:MAG: Cof-type HAD-IIB family hydrolase [Coriobacteriales bacterium]|nr:Cof-type HAD-IIB family hydrolase [Coriobacteriales bacterium]
MIKAILLDIDGTLTNDQKEITPRTREALLGAQDAGAVLVLASGRPNMGLTRMAKTLDMAHHNGIFVCFNGAKAMNCQTGQVYFQQTLTVSQGQRVLEHMHNFDVCPIYDRGDYMYLENAFFSIVRDGEPWEIAEYEAHNNNYLMCEVADNAKFMDWELNKILVAGQPEYLQQVWQQMAAPFEGELSSMFTAPYYYEFTPLGVDKTKALRETFATLGIDQSEVIAFGDAQNDKSMIEWSGIGVAMGNAVDEVKAVADYVTLSNNEDGIAAALEHFKSRLQ